MEKNTRIKNQRKSGKKDGEEKTNIKNLSFCGFGIGGNVTAVDVKDGKIIRLRPLHRDWKYDPAQFRPWKIKARGKTFEPGMKTLLPPLALGYKKRVYSANRILFPLKRADFDPDGEGNIHNRGYSGYVR